MSGTPPVRLTESGGWSTWTLTADQARALSDSRLVHVRPLGGGQWQLSAKDRVGAVRLGRGHGTVQLSIEPKTSIDRLLFLIGYAPERVTWDDRPVDAEERSELLPALAYAFTSSVRRALLHGVLLDYRQTEATLPVLRGRLRLTDQLRRRPGLPLPMEVTYDDHTVDIPENRLMLGAIRRLLRVPGVESRLRTELTGFLALLDGVTPVLPGSPLPQWSRNRRNQRYHQALGLAELILRGASYELGDGRTITVDGLLVRVWQLYEGFLAQALGQELRIRAGGRPEPHDRDHHLDSAGQHPLDPDLVHYLPRPDGVLAPAIVVDAKYKKKFDRDDLYQMLAYCLRLGLPDGHLVYASGRPGTVEVPTGDRIIRLHRHAVDPALPVTALRDRIGALAGQLLRIRAESS